LTKFYSVLHPSIRLAYFEDTSKWDESIAARARVLLEHLYDVYKEETASPESSLPKLTPTASVFLDAIRNLPPSQLKAAIMELEAYFNGTYPCLDGDALKWWKVSLICGLPLSCYWLNQNFRSTLLSFLSLPELLVMFWPFPVLVYLLSSYSQVASILSQILVPL
jgi:hypothetical protein